MSQHPGARPTSVVFDLFHTLVDTEHVRPAGFDYRALVAEMIGADEGDFRSYWAEVHRRRVTTGVDQSDLVDRYQTALGRPVLDGDQRSEFDSWLGVAKDDALLAPEPEMLSLLAEVSAAVPVGVLSNCHDRETRAWPDSPLAPLVEGFVRSCDIGALKPEPATYRAVLDAIGADAASCVYVGNGSSDELAGAIEAGFAVVVHMNGFDRHNGLVGPAEQRRRSAQAHHRSDSIGELGARLREVLGLKR